MSSLCREMRSTFLAQRPVMQKSSAPRSNTATDSSMQNNCPISLPARPSPPVKVPIPAQTKSYSQMATANPEKHLSEVRLTKKKAPKDQDLETLDPRLAKARPDWERRVIFHRRPGSTPLSRQVAVEILHWLNKALQGKKYPAYMRFLKLEYNSMGNLTGPVSKSSTAEMLLPMCWDLLLKTSLEMDKDIQ